MNDKQKIYEFLGQLDGLECICVDYDDFIEILLTSGQTVTFWFNEKEELEEVEA